MMGMGSEKGILKILPLSGTNFILKVEPTAHLYFNTAPTCE
jgi:hypothetical protein